MRQRQVSKRTQEKLRRASVRKGKRRKKKPCRIVPCFLGESYTKRPSLHRGKREKWKAGWVCRNASMTVKASGTYNVNSFSHPGEYCLREKNRKEWWRSRGRQNLARQQETKRKNIAWPTYKKNQRKQRYEKSKEKKGSDL